LIHFHLTNIKHFPWWYAVISTRVGNGKARNCVETRRQKMRSVFTRFRVFPISTSWYLYQHGSSLANRRSEFTNAILYLTIIERGWARYEELSSPKFINRSRRLRLITANWGLDNSSHCAKTEFNNCFIIYLKNSKQTVVHLFARVYQPIKN
jgi:hypothetical protein